MQRVRTDEYSVEAIESFDDVSVQGSSIGFRRDPDGQFSPTLSLWTMDADPHTDMGTYVARCQEGQGRLAEHRALTVGGMTGVYGESIDTLEDYETGCIKDWHRLRAVLAGTDRLTWYHCTAMAASADLPMVYAALLRLFATLEITLTGAAAKAARDEDGIDPDALIDHARAAYERWEDATEPARLAARLATAALEAAAARLAALAPVPPVAERFAGAVAAAGLADRSDALRAIVDPVVSLTETGLADPARCGQTRIGGGPDLPEGAEWPRDDIGLHLNFLAQIDLADLPDVDGMLPASGLLSCFIGDDEGDARILYTPAATPRAAHPLAEEAMDVSQRVARLLVWDGKARCRVADGGVDGDIAVIEEADGRLRVLLAGKPTVAFSSENFIPASAQQLRVERALRAPDDPAAYADMSIVEPETFQNALAEAFRIGMGPQHRLFGTMSARLAGYAVDLARRRGWQDLLDPDDWFALLTIRSGGDAGFWFWDGDDVTLIANRHDSARGDFTRIHAVFGQA